MCLHRSALNTERRRSLCGGEVVLGLAVPPVAYMPVVLRPHSVARRRLSQRTGGTPGTDSSSSASGQHGVSTGQASWAAEQSASAETRRAHYVSTHAVVDIIGVIRAQQVELLPPKEFKHCAACTHPQPVPAVRSGVCTEGRKRESVRGTNTPTARATQRAAAPRHKKWRRHAAERGEFSAQNPTQAPASARTSSGWRTRK